MPFLSLLDIRFWLNILLFTIFAVLNLAAFWPLLGKKGSSKKQRSKQVLLSGCLAVCLFFIIWPAQGYLFGYLQIRWMRWIVLLATGFVGVYRLWRAYQHKLFFLPKLSLSWQAWVLVVVGIWAQVSAIVTSGLRNAAGVTFHTLNGVDGVLHLAFADFMKGSFPPVQPGAIGLTITNYHYWSDLLFSEVSLLTTIPTSQLYFQLYPVLIAVVLTVATILLVDVLGGNKVAQWWALFMHFFAGNAFWLLSLIVNQKFGWNMPAIDHGVLQFLNMPQAFARLIFIVGFIYWWKWMQKPSWSKASIWAVLFASLFGFKVYWGIFAVVIVSIWLAWKSLGYLWNVFKNKDFSVTTDLKQLLMGYGLFGVLASLIFFPVNKGAGTLFWAPFAWPKLIMGQTNLEINEWWLRLQVYEAAGNTKALIVWYGIAVTLFVIGVFGTRLLGIIPPIAWLRSKQHRALVSFMWPVAIVLTFIGMNVLQSSGGSNVFNFFILSLWIAGTFVAFNMAWLQQNAPRWLYLSTAVLVLILSVPRPLQDLAIFARTFYHTRQDAFRLSNSELEALTFLKNKPDGIVQSHPKHKHDFYETPYIALMTEKQSYLGGQGILLSHNQPVQEREEVVQTIFNSTNSAKVRAALDESGISYLYMRSDLYPDRLKIGTQSGFFTEIYNQGSIKIYQAE